MTRSERASTGLLLMWLCVGVSACDLALPFMGSPAPSTVAVRQADLPGSIHRCAGSGDISSYLNALRQQRPDIYKPSQDEWNAMQGRGATDAWIEVFAESRHECTSVFGAAPTAEAKPKVVQNIVIRFKDETSAARAYDTGIFNLKPSQTTPQPGLTKGSATGLGSRSMTFFSTEGGRAFFVAFWQNKLFAVLFSTTNIGHDDAKKAVNSINSRIR